MCNFILLQLLISIIQICFVEVGQSFLWYSEKIVYYIITLKLKRMSLRLFLINIGIFLFNLKKNVNLTFKNWLYAFLKQMKIKNYPILTYFFLYSDWILWTYRFLLEILLFNFSFIITWNRCRKLKQKFINYNDQHYLVICEANQTLDSC